MISEIMLGLTQKLVSQIPDLVVVFDRLTTEENTPNCSITILKTGNRNPSRNLSMYAEYETQFQIVLKASSDNANGTYAQLVEKDALIEKLKTALNLFLADIVTGSLVINNFLYVSGFEIPFVDVPEVDQKIMVVALLQVVGY